jgi:O-acetyl-ADP-ribose deacetylase (regulator of RNase III)
LSLCKVSSYFARDGKRGEAEELRDAVKNSLELAHSKGWSGIAIPAISSGIFGFPKRYCAEIMFDVALKFIQEFGSHTPLTVRSLFAPYSHYSFFGFSSQAAFR